MASHDKSEKRKILSVEEDDKLVLFAAGELGMLVLARPQRAPKHSRQRKPLASLLQ